MKKVPPISGKGKKLLQDMKSNFLTPFYAFDIFKISSEMMELFNYTKGKTEAMDVFNFPKRMRITFYIIYQKKVFIKKFFVMI